MLRLISSNQSKVPINLVLRHSVLLSTLPASSVRYFMLPLSSVGGGGGVGKQNIIQETFSHLKSEYAFETPIEYIASRLAH